MADPARWPADCPRGNIFDPRLHQRARQLCPRDRPRHRHARSASGGHDLHHLGVPHESRSYHLILIWSPTAATPSTPSFPQCHPAWCGQLLASQHAGSKSPPPSPTASCAVSGLVQQRRLLVQTIKRCACKQWLVHACLHACFANSSLAPSSRAWGLGSLCVLFAQASDLKSCAYCQLLLTQGAPAASSHPTLFAAANTDQLEHWCGVQMRLRTGEVCDRYSLADDFVHLHHNAGIHLCKDLLLILAVSGYGTDKPKGMAMEFPRASASLMAQQTCLQQTWVLSGVQPGGAPAHRSAGPLLSVQYKAMQQIWAGPGVQLGAASLPSPSTFGVLKYSAPGPAADLGWYRWAARSCISSRSRPAMPSL